MCVHVCVCGLCACVCMYDVCAHVSCFCVPGCKCMDVCMGVCLCVYMGAHIQCVCIYDIYVWAHVSVFVCVHGCTYALCTYLLVSGCPMLGQEG